MDQIAAIRLFARIVETGSFTRAAAHLGMPKSTASKLLGELESYLGSKLLHRSTRSTKLTDEGTDYYNKVSQILVQLSDADAELRETGSGPSGRVRVDVPSSIANTHLIPILGEFRSLYPKIQLVMGISDRPIRLIEEAADCVIRVGRLPDASLVARLLFESQIVTCGSPDYLSRKGVPISPRDLVENHDLVGYFSALTGETTPLTFQRGDEIYRFEATGILSNDSTGHLTMLLAGLGIGQSFRSNIHRYIADGRLVPILPDWRTRSAPVSILYPARPNKRVRLFLDWVIDRLPKEIAKSAA